MRKFKYFGAYLIPLFGLYTFNSTGIYAFFGLFFLYVLVPVLEQILPLSSYNLNKAEKELAKESSFFDLTLYLLVPLHLFVIYSFLITVSGAGISTLDLIAYVLMMGTILGVI